MLLQRKGFRNQQNNEYYNFFQTYFDADHVRDLADRRSVTPIVNLFNGTLTYRCSKKQSGTSRISPNAKTRAMYTGLLDKNWIRNFFVSSGYPIGPP